MFGRQTSAGGSGRCGLVCCGASPTLKLPLPTQSGRSVSAEPLLQARPSHPELEDKEQGQGAQGTQLGPQLVDLEECCPLSQQLSDSPSPYGSDCHADILFCLKQAGCNLMCPSHTPALEGLGRRGSRPGGSTSQGPLQTV